jgi:hypothetical protein
MLKITIHTLILILDASLRDFLRVTRHVISYFESSIIKTENTNADSDGLQAIRAIRISCTFSIKTFLCYHLSLHISYLNLLIYKEYRNLKKLSVLSSISFVGWLSV